MSDLTYNGGANGNTSITTDGNSFSGYAADYYAKAAQRAEFDRNNYDHSGTNTFTADSFTSSNINMENPYKEIVIVGGKKWTTFDFVRGRITNSQDHYQLTYGVNTAYIDFEKSIFDTQKDLLNTASNNNSISFNENMDLFLEETTNNYDIDKFGDTSSINNLAKDISDTEKHINTARFEDAHSRDYNRITNTDNSDFITDASSELEKLYERFNYEKALYDNKEFQTKLKQIRDDMNAESGEWKIDTPQWIVTPPPPFPLNFSNTIAPDPKEYFILNTTGEVNRWMAGGDLYDAPRAGGVMFNVTGNLNTVHFLGLKDTNSTSDLVQRFVNPSVSSMFGPMAGDENFSVL